MAKCLTKGLTVWWSGEIVGYLALNEYGEPEFAYASDWLAKDGACPVSVSLPLQADSFDRRTTLPFFEGLLPEASQREAVAKALGVSKRNEFRLLEKLGGEVAGAIEIWPDGVAPSERESHADLKSLDDDELVELIGRLPARPMLAGGEGGLRLSLAGAQSKLPIILVGDRIALPAAGQPTTHILKPEIARFRGTAENEAFCMKLAASIGLDVAPVEYRTLGETRFILVERYDRSAGVDGTTIRLHQEDFCQALRFTSARKYASDGGPVFRDCFALLRRVSTRPAAETLKLLDAAIFNAIIGNADAHAKNFSLLYRPRQVEMAPLYDLLSTVQYPDLSQRFAMRIGGRRTLEEINPSDWTKFAGEIEMRPPFVRKRVQDTSAAILAHADNTLEDPAFAGDREMLASACADAIKDRATKVLKGMASSN